MSPSPEQWRDCAQVLRDQAVKFDQLADEAEEARHPEGWVEWNIGGPTPPGWTTTKDGNVIWRMKENGNLLVIARGPGDVVVPASFGSLRG